MAKAAPFPVSRLFDQSAFHGIPMQVAQLHGELDRISNIPVVVALLPERDRDSVALL